MNPLKTIFAKSLNLQTVRSWRFFRRYHSLRVTFSISEWQTWFNQVSCLRKRTKVSFWAAGSLFCTKGPFVISEWQFWADQMSCLRKRTKVSFWAAGIKCGDENAGRRISFSEPFWFSHLQVWIRWKLSLRKVWICRRFEVGDSSGVIVVSE